MKKCLIVDDEEQNRYFLDVLLRGNGYATVLAENGAEALAKARANPPDLVITDLLMPVMDGFTLCREWKSDERLKSIPLVVYTATYTEARDEAFALSLGADLFLVKPQEPDVLAAELRKVLEKVLQKVAAGEVAAVPSIGSEDFSRRHYETVIRKLEDKMAQLEQMNVRLNETIAEKDKAQEEIRTLNAELEQRVRLRTAELQAANEELEAFSSSVSHDLRAPLHIIDGFSEVLLQDYQDRALDDAGRACLEKIRTGTQRMSHLIDDLLQLSRITRTELNRGPVDLSRMIRNLLNKSSRDNPACLPEILVEDGVTVSGDFYLLEIAMGNIIDNAWKFTCREEHPRIEFGTLQQNEKTVCYIRDNGAGFDAGSADRLFIPFQRLHSQREFPGTGIGLATVRRIIKRHGGKIWAEGAVGCGATLYFTL